MNNAGIIVSIITVIGCLILAARSSALRRLSTGHVLALALLWIAIIVGLVVVIKFTGLRIGQ